jgi:hypothetical protein
MTTRLKALLTVLAVVIIVAAVGLFYYQKQLKSSADTFNTFGVLKHHPSSAFAGLKHHPLSAFNALKTHHKQGFTISGTITNINTKKPIANIKIKTNLDSSSALTTLGTTGPDGKYDVKVNKQGVYQFNFVDESGSYAAMVTPIYVYSTPIIKSFTLTPEKIVSYAIATKVGVGGVISPSGTTQVSKGSSQAYTITPNQGYKIKYVTVDGKSVGAVSTYTFNNVITGHNINASFEAVPVATAKGIVRSAGALLPGATINIYKTGSSVIVKSLKTDDKGAYQVVGLSAGKYTATATARICRKVLFWNSCSDKTRSASFDFSADKNILIPTLYF